MKRFAMVCFLGVFAAGSMASAADTAQCPQTACVPGSPVTCACWWPGPNSTTRRDFSVLWRMTSAAMTSCTYWVGGGALNAPYMFINLTPNAAGLKGCSEMLGPTLTQYPNISVTCGSMSGTPAVSSADMGMNAGYCN